MLSRFGCVNIPKYNYEEKCSEFHFWSCITRSEVISSTVRLRSECNKVLKLNLLSTHYNKSLRLEDFEQMQAQSIEQTSIQLRDRYLLRFLHLLNLMFICSEQYVFSIHISLVVSNALMIERNKKERMIYWRLLRGQMAYRTKQEIAS